MVKTQEKAVVRSKYVEDEHKFGHTSVWGSYYKEGKWGYKCCRSFDRHEYCKAVVEAPPTSPSMYTSDNKKEEPSSSPS